MRPATSWPASARRDGFRLETRAARSESADNRDQDHCANNRDDEAHRVQTSDAAAGEGRAQPAAQERADDADDHILDHATAAAVHNSLRQETDDQTNHDPD